MIYGIIVEIVILAILDYEWHRRYWGPHYQEVRILVDDRHEDERSDG